jgi:PhzF family phenazine biosynthesis protein
MRRFLLIDVFTAEGLRGNPLGVVVDAQGLDAGTMQRFTDWMNLSECSFLLPPSTEGAASGADYRVRIFCPGQELPFAGHPTLGSARAWLHAGGRPRTAGRLVQECGVGLVPLRGDPDPGSRLWFAAPPRRRTDPLDDTEVQALCGALGLQRPMVLDSAWCDNGPPWQALLLDSAARVLALRPALSRLGGRFVGVAGLHPGATATGGAAATPALEVRAFFPKAGGETAEDPVTGSLNAALGQWLTAAGRLPARYVAAQGTVLGRAGRVQVQAEDETVWIGGDTVVCIEGQVVL